MVNGALPLRHESHVKERQSRLRFQAMAPPQWIIDSFSDDYGLDLFAMPFYNNISSGHIFGIQLKARINTGRNKDFASVSVKTSTLNWWLKINIPVVVVLEDLGDGTFFWGNAVDMAMELTQRKGLSWKKSRELTLRIPRSQVLAGPQDFEILLSTLPKPSDDFNKINEQDSAKYCELISNALDLLFSQSTFTLEQMKKIGKMDSNFIKSSLNRMSFLTSLPGSRYTLAEYSPIALAEVFSSKNPKVISLIGRDNWITPPDAEICAKIIALHASQGFISISDIENLFPTRPDIYIHSVSNLFFISPDSAYSLKDVYISSKLVNRMDSGVAKESHLTFTTNEKMLACKRILEKDKSWHEIISLDGVGYVVKMERIEDAEEKEMKFILFEPHGLPPKFNTAIIGGKQPDKVRAVEIRASFEVSKSPFALIYTNMEVDGALQFNLDGIPFHIVGGQEMTLSRRDDGMGLALSVDDVILQIVLDGIPLEKIPTEVQGRKQYQLSVSPTSTNDVAFAFILPLSREVPPPQVMSALEKRYTHVQGPEGQ